MDSPNRLSIYVAGREGERYYTADHYRSLRRIVP